MPRRRPGTPVDPAAAEFKDWQDHQYVEGYYTGGRIPPYLRGRRPNPYGYALLASGGCFAVMFGVLAIVALLGLGDLSPGTLIFGGALTALFLVAGIRLLRRPRRGA